MPGSQSPRSAAPMVLMALIVATALIHFIRAAADPEIRVLFILNGLGYLVLGALLFVPKLQPWQRLIRRILIGYTAVTVALYVVWGMSSGDWTMPLGPIDKAIELALIVLLWQADRRSVGQPSSVL